MGFPQKLTKVTKELHAVLCFLRLLGVQKSPPQSRQHDLVIFWVFPICVHLRLKSESVLPGRTQSYQLWDVLVSVPSPARGDARPTET